MKNFIDQSLKQRLLEYFLVFVQFATLGYLVLTSYWHSMPVWVLAVVAAAGMLAIWAILTMRLDNLKVTPSPAAAARLVTSGPYRLIRHPMYASLLLLMAPLVIQQFSILRLLLGMLLAIDLVLKLNYEENLLQAKFPEYDSYKRQSYRVIPFIY